MPVITVSVWDEVLDPAREAALLAGVTDSVVEVLGENSRPFTTVMIVSTPMRRWAVGGVVAQDFEDLPARRSAVRTMLEDDHRPGTDSMRERV